MRESELQIEFRARYVGAVSNANEGQFNFKSFQHTRHTIFDKSAIEAVQRFLRDDFFIALEEKHLPIVLEMEARRELEFQMAFRPFECDDSLFGGFHFNSLGDGNGGLSKS
jgi:hypothetical protein